MNIYYRLRFATVLCLFISFSCSKTGGTNGGGGGGTADPCAGITVTVSLSSTNPGSGLNDGTISAIATGGPGPFTFSLNGGSYQSSASFTGLAAGTYAVSAKNSSGCTGSALINLVSSSSCAGITINISSNITGHRPCEGGNGSITVNASGGTAPYTYSLNGSVFSSLNQFTRGPGTYSVTAKDANGCTGTLNNLVINTLPAGPLFTAVKNVIATNCISCHNNVLSEGGMNWEIECNIVDFKMRIQQRAITGSPSIMPPTGALPPSEQQKITNWINAGGRYTD